MAIQVQWADEAHTIIKWDFPKEIVWDDYTVANAEAAELAASVSHEVFTLFDMSNLQNLPANVVVRFPSVARSTPPNVKMSVMVGAALYVENLGRVFSRIYGKIQFARTVEAAFEVIDSHRSSAPPDAP
ncbi:MAG: hypothetical protein JW910_15710 [Anaerolineae bacterium]|nr:hypothetical protein [Anaerolineae bacterium]